MHHRTIALLILAGCTAVALAPQAARRAGWGDWGGALGSLLVPFFLFVLVNLLVYVAARLLAPADQLADWRRTRLNYVGLAVAVGVLLLPLDEAAG